MTFDRAVSFLNSRALFGWVLGLDKMHRILADLGDPQKRIRFVHIAGTNGKGSVAAMLASIFENANYKTGLYTSPHLIDVRERVRLNGAIIGKRDFSGLLQALKPLIVKYEATYFETMTALAFLYFAEHGADIVFLEVGLGGRLDATNVIIPELAIITSISLDHTEHLGSTLKDIAGEKAGIIKSERPCLVGEMPAEIGEIFLGHAAEKKAPLYRCENLIRYTIKKEELGKTCFMAKLKTEQNRMYVLRMNGEFQVANACLAIAACDILSSQGWSLKKKNVASGLENVDWPGRFQVVQQKPLVIFDVAHNVASMRRLAGLLRKFCLDRKIFVVLGLLKDKDVGQITQIIAEIADFIQPVEPDSDRAFPARELHKYFTDVQVNFFPPHTVSEGLRNVLSHSGEGAAVCVTGSHYVIGEALKAIKGLTK